MKKILAPALLILLALISFCCQKEISYDGGTPISPVATDPITTSLQGTVFDEGGQPAVGVTIKAGSKTAVTDTRGYFRIANAPLDKYASVITAEKNGYFKAIRNFYATSGTNQVMIKLIKKISAATINAASGGEVSLSNGAKIILPANGVVNAQTNAAYTGNVTVYAAYIDPTGADIGREIPGSLLATDKDNKKVILTSYGMMAVELYTASGDKLQIASGKTATLTTPIPASIASSAPATIPLWYVDEQTGLWKEEGVATKNGTVYTGEVKHFTYWNCDVPGPTVNFTATLKNADDTPISSASVTIRPASGGNGGSAHGFTDTLGQISGPIPANRALILEVWGGSCNTVVYSQNLGPYSSNINYGTITIPNTNPAMVTVKGKLVNCNNAAITNGYAKVYFNYTVMYCPVNANGEFSTVLFSCVGFSATCEIYAVDAAASQQSATLSYPISLPLTNAGTIAACGTSTLEYINYSIDGVSYSLNNTTTDSIYAWQYDNIAWQAYPTYYQVFGKKQVDELTYNFYGNPIAGIYPLTYFRTQVYQRTAPVSPISINLTNYPAAIGGFYEGNFAGQFRDTLDLAPIHTINCSFRVRKY